MWARIDLQQSVLDSIWCRETSTDCVLESFVGYVRHPTLCLTAVGLSHQSTHLWIYPEGKYPEISPRYPTTKSTETLLVGMGPDTND
mmetsp:Transcript_7422/g.7298  ORF Transcript_7422/g.7298 Transcript_7422/m.7298 type:complete len:87 (-) Transcript_7422:143-403(-)